MSTVIIAADGGAVALGILLLVAFIGSGIAYHSWLQKGLRERVMTTRLPPETVKGIFTAKVAGLGWSVVDQGNPMVAQSPLLAGRRQQISLSMTRQGDVLRCSIRPTRVWVKGLARTPYKAHTLRLRLNAFERAVEAAGAGLSSRGPVQVAAARPAAPSARGAVAAAVASPSPARPPAERGATDVAARWAADPYGRHELRYFNGAEWTDSVADQGVVGRDPARSSVAPVAPVAPAAPASAAPPASSWPMAAVDDVVSRDAVASAEEVHDGRTVSRSAMEARQADGIDHDGATVVRRPKVQLPEFVLRVDNGEELRISGPTLIGRSPRPQPGEASFRQAVVNDASLTVSKTHLLVEPATNGLMVTDRGSANGTSIIAPGASNSTPVTDVGRLVEPGMVIQFGDRSATVHQV